MEIEQDERESLLLLEPKSSADKSVPQSSCCSGRGGARKSSVDILFIRRLGRLFAIMNGSFFSVDTLLFIVTMAIVMGNEVLVYFVGLLPSQLITGLLKRDASIFLDVLWRAAVFTVSEAFILSLVSFLMGVLALRWRRHLVRHLHQSYMSGHRFFSILYPADGGGSFVDNPDQRIVEDCMQLCLLLSQMLQWSATPGSIIFYTQQVASLTGWSGPLLVYGYFVVGCICNRFLMSRVADSVWRQERLEGNFRYLHARLRSSAEQVALTGGGSHERELLDVSFGETLKNSMELLKRRFVLDLSRNTFAYVGAFFSYIVVGFAMQYGGAFSGLDPAEFAGALQRASFFCISLVGGFSDLVNLASSTSDLAGYTTRVAQIHETLYGMAQDENSSEMEIPSLIVNNEDRTDEIDFVEFDHVDVATPDGLPLIDAVSFVVPRRRSLIITGPCGSGKSSIVRLMKGLWHLNPQHGRIRIPSNEHICFVPQDPYLPSGTLADLLMYPSTKSSSSSPHSLKPLPTDETLLDLLNTVRLGYLCRRFSLSDVRDWSTTLSPGEKQKIGVARVILARPWFAVLDESTSAMALEDESYLYQLLKSMDVTIVSIGHRPSLLEFHEMHLSLEKNCAWHLRDLDSASVE